MQQKIKENCYLGGGALFFGSKRINMWWGESTAP